MTRLCSLQAQPLKPRRERPEKSEEWHRRSAKLRELEEELLGGGGSSQTAGTEPENVGGDAEKTEDGEEEDYGERGTQGSWRRGGRREWFTDIGCVARRCHW